uniref:Heat shock protein 12B n=1 Tax=Poecilia reticulata TaxID=8081 RepID=A0A3P9PKB2_POERE
MSASQVTGFAAEWIFSFLTSFSLASRAPPSVTFSPYLDWLSFLSAMGDSFVIAIDFGSAFSGYAFNITPREEKSEPYLPRWGKEYGLDSPKTPTCILLNEDENVRVLAMKPKTFPILDYTISKQDKLSSDLKIKAANGKSMKALKVFSDSLRFLKEDALRTISRNTGGERLFIPSDFTWVLTVPAIWDPSAKQFMREAAMQAGIITEGDEEKLVLALEPEAASIWCKKLPADGFISDKHNSKSMDQSAGTQYIVVDCGGKVSVILMQCVIDSFTSHF